MYHGSSAPPSFDLRTSDSKNDGIHSAELAKRLEAKTTEQTEQGLASADRTKSTLAFATKGKTQLGREAVQSCKSIWQMKCRVAQLRRSRRHREELCETVKGGPWALSKAAAR